MTFKNTIIFGASGDIGSAFVKKLHERTESLTLVVREKSRLEALLMDYSRVKIIEFSFPDNLENLDKEILNISEDYDLIVNAVGSYKTTDDIFDQLSYENMLMNNFYVLQHILNALKSRIHKTAKIINVSSIASHLGSDQEMAYSSSKILVDNIMASLKNNAHYKNVKTLNVRPGAVISTITKDRPDNTKFINPDDIADLCLNIILSGSSLDLPVIDIFRSRS
jgi:short-subunit dehydrogenase